MTARAARLGPMTRLQRALVTRGLALPPVTTRATVEHDLVVTAADGTPLLTDHWAPAEPSGTTVLLRTPYGRRSAAVTGSLLAERGHHVVVQSCRGTFGSGGRWDPFHHERADGAAAVAWLLEQPWSGERFVTAGPSYLGLTQWAIADTRPPGLAGMVVAVSARSFRDAVVYPGEGFALETAVSWNVALDAQERPLPVRLARLLRLGRTVAAGCRAVPQDALRSVLGHDMPGYQDWLAHDAPDDPWWRPLTFCQDPAGLPPIRMVAGWQDLFLVEQLADVAALRAAGTDVTLRVGPWTHTDAGLATAALAELFAMLAELDRPGPPPERPDRVRLTLTGSGGDTELALPEWPSTPPVGTLHLHADGGLRRTPAGIAPAGRTSAGAGSAGGASASAVPAGVGDTTITTDPDDPTPSAGGRSLNPFTSGVRDQRPRERRDDVAVFTSTPLAEALTVVGDPVVRLVVSCAAPSSDLFVRLCEVRADGRSVTVSDGYRRTFSTADRTTVELPLAPTGHRFARGSSVRLQVSGGAHPLLLRHPGSADPLHDFSAPRPVRQQVHHGPGVVSSLTLPVARVG